MDEGSRGLAGGPLDVDGLGRGRSRQVRKEAGDGHARASSAGGRFVSAE